jgi:hypothetical protein
MEYTIQDIIDAAVEQEPTKMQTAFDQLIGPRIMDALETKKKDIAASMFSSDDEVTAEVEPQEMDTETLTTETEAEVEDEDTETAKEDA